MKNFWVFDESYNSYGQIVINTHKVSVVSFSAGVSFAAGVTTDRDQSFCKKQGLKGLEETFLIVMLLREIMPSVWIVSTEVNSAKNKVQLRV